MDEDGLLIFTFEPLDATHNVVDFRCGNNVIDEYLHGPARQESHKDITKTFVATAAGDEIRPLSFFTLKTTQVDIPSQSVEGFKERYEPAEIIYLARDLTVRKTGVGDALLAEALSKIVEASQRVGIPGIYLRSTREGVKLYERFGFTRLSPMSSAFFMPIRTARQAIRETPWL